MGIIPLGTPGGGWAGCAIGAYQCRGVCVHHGVSLRMESSPTSDTRFRFPAATFALTLAAATEEVDADADVRTGSEELGGCETAFIRLRTSRRGSSFEVSESESDSFPSSPTAGLEAGVVHSVADRRNEQEVSSDRSSVSFSFSFSLLLDVGLVSPTGVLTLDDVTTVGGRLVDKSVSGPREMETGFATCGVEEGRGGGGAIDGGGGGGGGGGTIDGGGGGGGGAIDEGGGGSGGGAIDEGGGGGAIDEGGGGGAIGGGGATAVRGGATTGRTGRGVDTEGVMPRNCSATCWAEAASYDRGPARAGRRIERRVPAPATLDVAVTGLGAVDETGT